jgi:zinc transport system substrate-binding protein
MLHGNMAIINSTEISAYDAIPSNAKITDNETITVKNLYSIMHQTTRSFYIFINTSLLSLILSTFSFSTSAADNIGPILVTIKPLYSLVAHLTEGIETPVLLMKQTQSPHHYNMRPSERDLLAKARMIIWFGPQMESFLSKIIQQQNSSTISVSVIQAKNLKLLGKRTKHTHEHNHSSSTYKPEAHTIDPHIWLSAHNAIAISHHITESLISNEPKNSELYKKNLQRLVSKINQSKNLIKSTLKNRSQPYIAFHDAFQYFENEYDLNYIDSISYDEETGTSLKHIRQIKADIDKNNIQCLVYQAPKPAIINSLTKQTSIKATALDPLGLNIDNDKNAWFELMQQLAVDFNYCLNP